MCSIFFFLIIRRPPRSTRTDTHFPYTTPLRSPARHTGAAIADHDLDVALAVEPRGHGKNPIQRRHLAHRLAGIHDEVEQNLLQLNTVAADRDRKSTRLNSSH